MWAKKIKMGVKFRKVGELNKIDKTQWPEASWQAVFWQSWLLQENVSKLSSAPV